MEIREAQNLVHEQTRKVGYHDIETTPTQVFLHLVEEVGEVSRNLLYKETKRGEKIKNTTVPKEFDDEIADLLWQTLRLASYLNIDLEDAFNKKYAKNAKKSEQ